MTSAKPVFVGVDVGASRAKAVVLGPNKNLLGYSVEKSGTDFTLVADRCLAASLEMAGVSRNQMVNAVSTGYGRKNVSFAKADKTEIGCHSRGCFLYFPKPITIIDIGGQDNKIIKLDEKGRRINFKMNRKCAAGTGAFLEEMSLRLNIPIEEMDALARQSREMVKLGSFCTVFSATEVLENIRQGEKGNRYHQRIVFLSRQKGVGNGFFDRERGHDRRCGGPQSLSGDHDRGDHWKKDPGP